jgi:hypothetical protein
MRKIWIVSLTLVPSLVLAGWAWHQVRKAEEQLGALDNFKGMHLEA